MKAGEVYTSLGLMSGTSMDGVDAAVIRTDGERVIERLGFQSAPYPKRFRDQIATCLNRRGDPDGVLAETEHAITQIHANLVKSFGGGIDVIGFHGQTIWHDPAQGKTLQVGNARFLANMTGLPVVHDFRSNDMAHGGQGAPLIPVYHRAIVETKNTAVINIGGVGNVTFIGDAGDLIAFDTGPGNALIDDLVRAHNKGDFDAGGAVGLSGMVDEARLRQWMQNPYFHAPPPKSLDRNDFDGCDVSDMSLADGAATLAAFTAQSIIAASRHLPTSPDQWVVCGGGRHNLAIMQGMQRLTNAPVINADDLGWDGDAIEAEGFAFMAVRSMLGLPLSFPSTTGVSHPITGGRIVNPDSQK